jgi:hypothetical protein
MKARSAFEKGLVELHGPGNFRSRPEAEVFEDDEALRRAGPARSTKPRMPDQVGLRLAVGALGLFWGIVILALLLAGLAIVGLLIGALLGD